MKAQTLSHGILDMEDHEKWTVSKWTKFISTAYFAEAIILFLFSILLFIVKKTEGVDSYMITGAHAGTTQLTFFVLVNLLAMVFAVSGYYLYQFTKEYMIEENINDYLRQYFKVTGIASIPVFCMFITGILFFVFR